MFLRKFRTLFRNGKLDAEMADEMRAHLELQAAENEKCGMSPEEARFAAQRQFGGVEQIKERARDERGIRWLEDFMRDVYFAARSLRKAPGFTAVVVLSLALGIGANTALFSIVKKLVLQPLPGQTADGLVDIIHGQKEWVERWKSGSNRRRSVAPADFLDWKAQSQSFEGMTTFGNGDDDSKNAVLRGDNEREAICSARVFANFFPLLRVTPMFGRGFRPEEDDLKSEPVAVLSHGLWQRRFGGSAGALGKTITITKIGTSNSTICTIVGVMPRAMPMFDKVELWMSQPASEKKMTARAFGSSSIVLARLKPGVTLAQAQREMDVITQRIYRAYPESFKGDNGWAVALTPVRDVVTREPQRHLLLLFAIAGCVLLIACANVANLLLVRAAGRQKEIAIRAVIGADRWRLVRQLFAESLLLAGMGGALGVLVATGALALFNAFAPANLYGTTYRVELPIGVIGIDRQALAFTGGLALVTGIFFGMVPALRGSKTNLNHALKDGGQAMSAGPNRQRFGKVLVVVQVMLALVLVSSAGLLANSFVRLENEDLGYKPTHLLRMEVGLAPASKFIEDTKKKETRNLISIWQPKPQRDIFLRSFVQRLKAIPGVEAVAVKDAIYYSTPIFIEGLAPPQPFSQGARGWYFSGAERLSPDSLRAMGMPLLRGRDFTEHDAAGSVPVAIVSEEFVRRYFPNWDPIGRHITDTFGQHREIVGVVADNFSFDGTVRLDWKPEWRNPMMYWPLLQPPLLQSEGVRMIFMIRTGASLRPTAAALRSALREVDPEQTISSLTTMEEVIARKHAMPRFYALIFGGFAGLGLLISAIGVYGVTAYSVAQRTHEIGIRMALGAGRRDVLDLVVSQGMRLVLLGVAFGLVGAMAATRALSSLLYGVTPTDPVTFGAVTLLLGGVALLACYLPALRATKVDPMVALRCE